MVNEHADELLADRLLQEHRADATNTQTSCLPIAFCRSTAQTDESTPPDIASSTFRLPTCFLMASISSAMYFFALNVLPTLARRSFSAWFMSV